VVSGSHQAKYLRSRFDPARTLNKHEAVNGGRVVRSSDGKYHICVHVITRKRLNEFTEKYPETKSALAHWYGAMKKGSFSNIAEIRTVFPTADRVGKLTVFNIGGNRVRLIAAIHYNRKRVYIRAVLTHTEYDEGRWKE
jgi:mRNA interferase HigB